MFPRDPTRRVDLQPLQHPEGAVDGDVAGARPPELESWRELLSHLLLSSLPLRQGDAAGRIVFSLRSLAAPPRW